jgi:hypothetical protein
VGRWEIKDFKTKSFAMGQNDLVNSFKYLKFFIYYGVEQSQVDVVFVSFLLSFININLNTQEK